MLWVIFFDETMQGLLEAVEIEKEQNRLSSIYNITNVHAGCYMCNFENKYICVKHNQIFILWGERSKYE